MVVNARPNNKLMKSYNPFQILESDSYLSSVSDVHDGTVLLFKPRVKMEAITLPSVGREEEYEEILLRCDPDLHSFLEGYDKSRLKESSRVNELLDRIYINLSSRVPSWESVVDYSPLVGNMIKADDDEEAAHDLRITQILKEAQPHQNQDKWESASASLLKMGIRPSRQSARVLLEKGSDGLLALGKREADFARWILVDEHILKAARQSRLEMT